MEEEKVVWVFGMLAEEYARRVIWVSVILIGCGICYAILRNGVTGPLLFVSAMVMMFAVLTAGTLSPGAEVILEARLRVEDTTRHTVGKIVKFRRRGGSDSSTVVRLTVELEHGGDQYQGEIKTTIEDAVLADFATGKPIHLLYDPADPTRVAIDREASPTHVR